MVLDWSFYHTLRKEVVSQSPFINGILMRISRYLLKPDENLSADLHIRDVTTFTVLIQCHLVFGFHPDVVFWKLYHFKIRVAEISCFPASFQSVIIVYNHV